MQKVEFPKTYKEKLFDLNVGDSVVITKDKRYQYAVAMTNIKKQNKGLFTIRKNLDELRVWRLK